MKSINYALLVALSSFMLTACGGGSSNEGPIKEASIEEVGALIETPVDVEDAELSSRMVANSEQEFKKADWIPTMEDDTVGTNSKVYNVNYTSMPSISQKVIANGESTSGWEVYDNAPAGATIESVNDDEKGQVLEFNGDGLNNGYVIGYSFATGSTWNDKENTTIKWSMKYSEDYIIYVRVSTTYGYRYLYYTDSNKNYGEVAYDAPHYIHNGLGTTSNDGTWRTFTRDLNADLKRHQPMNDIISVDGFFVRGSGRIDDVELIKSTSDQVNQVIYEDAEDGKDSRWYVYDNDPTGATISNIEDTEKDSRVIKLDGDGLNNGYILGEWDSSKGWKNTINKEISWDMNYCENYVVYISVETAKGHRFITYSPLSEETFASNPNYGQGLVEEGGYTYIHLGLNPNTKSCSWQTISRNLEKDLQKYESDNSLVSINAFLVRGSGRLDNIKTFDTDTTIDFDPDTST